jgi:hypothetical protein
LGLYPKIDTSAAVSISASKTSAFTLGKWQHLVVTFDSAEPDPEDGIEMYIDGTLQILDSRIGNVSYVAMENGTAPLRIGTLATTTDPFEGKMSNVAVFDKALSLEEVVELYNEIEYEEFSDSDSVVSWWKFGASDSPSLVQDVSGSNNGAAVGTVLIGTHQEDDKFLWRNQRLSRQDTFTSSGDSSVDDARETLRRVSTRKTEGSTQVVKRGISFVEEDKPVLRNDAGATYSGQAYVTRALARPYKLNLDIAPTIHGGSNFSPTTKDPNAFIRAATRIIPGVDTVGIEVSSASNPTTYEEWKKKYTVKRSISVTIEDTEINLTQTFDGDFVYPYYGEDYRDASLYVAGNHNDSYGDDAEIPVQGPFTETWVGGNQHRHIHFTTQTDRPELFIDDSGILKHPHEVDPNNPAARYTRDGLAKRPVNVENIKSTSTAGDPLGNYREDYEIVQTSGRTKNNNWFVDNEGVSLVETSSPFVSGTVEFSLPDRGRTEHVFVERFSASVYNSMNFRNLEERLDYQKRLYTHSGIYQGSQGYEDTTTGLPSVHKVNRNGLYTLKAVGTSIFPAAETYECGYRYDNAYVSHQIPRSDLQYSFVTSSIDSLQYSPEVSTRCGDSIPLRYSGYYDDIHIVKGDEGYDAPYADYQAGGWRFIRNGESTQVALQRRNSTYSQVSRIGDGAVTSYVEPAIAWNKPNVHYILDERQTSLARQGADLNEELRYQNPISYSYSNNLEMFANKDLLLALNVQKSQDGQFLDSLLQVLENAELLFSRLEENENENKV